LLRLAWMELLTKSLEFVLWLLIHRSHLNGVTNVNGCGLLLRSVPRLHSESSHLAISSAKRRTVSTPGPRHGADVQAAVAQLMLSALALPARRTTSGSAPITCPPVSGRGQNLVALSSTFDMTRVGIAKHLSLLAEAGLVTTKRHGRETFHYLNPVPIRLIHDPWVSKNTEAWTAGLVGLKKELEIALENVFEIFISTTPERLGRDHRSEHPAPLPFRQPAGVGVDDDTAAVTAE